MVRICVIIYILLFPLSANAGILDAAKCLIGFCEMKIKDAPTYMRYLKGDDLYREYRVTVLSFDCDAIRLDEANFIRETAQKKNTFIDIQYYPKERAILYSHITGSIPSNVFQDRVKDISNSISRGQRLGPNIPEDDVYYAAMTRLFDEFAIVIGKHHHKFDLTGGPKCKGKQSG
tara:strand:+ start:71 stop:595 length:525 start_codon:yes stop_codon:yes gene_type:complete